MEGSRSHTFTIELIWYGRRFNGTTVVEAATVEAAVEATRQLLREIPDAGIVDHALALSSAPWAPGARRSVETVTITAPARRRGSSAELAWTGRNGTGTLRTLHDDWPVGLRTALADRMTDPHRGLDEVLDRIRRGAHQSIEFQLFGAVARTRVISVMRRG
jgi:hypothetical protein